MTAAPARIRKQSATLTAPSGTQVGWRQLGNPRRFCVKLLLPLYFDPRCAVSEPRIAVILPAYNEELTIAETVAAFGRALPEAAVYVVNNNSTDGTRQLAQEALDKLAGRGVVIDESRQGKGNALRRAFQDIEADVYLLADADLTYPAERARDMIAPVLCGRADMVVGDRHSGGHYARENSRSFHRFGNRLVQWLVNTLFGASLVDIMSGYRAFSRAFVKTYPILVEGFQIETDMTLHALFRRFRVLELPVEYRDRPDGSESKLHTLADGVRVLFAITQILRYYKPLAFFGGAAVIFAFFGLLAGLPVLDDWLRYQYIHHVPLSILAVGLELTAMILGAVALILDSIVHEDRRNFEARLLARAERVVGDPKGH